jgi:hypothetical protein
LSARADTGATNAAAGGPVLIMAGGTGGHVFPALAVAKVLRERGVAVVWLGVPGSMESRLVPAQGFPIEWVRVAGIRGKGLKTWLLAPLRIINAVGQAIRVLRHVKPRSVLGAGGYVSGPGGIAAWLMRIPLLIHEQNAIAGMTNRWLARLATQVLEAFPGSFGARANVSTIGNPVREDIAAIAAPAVRFAGREGCVRLLARARSGSMRCCRRRSRGFSPRIARRSCISPVSADWNRLARHTLKRRLRRRCCPSSTTWRRPTPGRIWRCAVPAP